MKNSSHRLPLRTLLLAIIVGISGIGLVATAFAVAQVMSNTMQARVDDDLKSAMDSWAWDPTIFTATQNSMLPSDFAVFRYMASTAMARINNQSATPDVNNMLVDGLPHTIPSTEDSQEQPQWRAIAQTDSNGVTTVVARSLQREEQVIRGLYLTEMMITAIVIILLGLLGYYALRKALKPLHEIEKTAAAISGGDFDRRMPTWPMNTEVGQLASTMNIMLGRLQEVIKESQDKEDQMRRFVGDASHELRTPLTSMRGYVELYRQGATQDVDKVLGTIESESSRMSCLVEDLLSLSRSEGNELVKRPVDLLEVAIDVVNNLKAAHPGRVIHIKNDCADIPIVDGAKGQLHQILLNLVNNALVHGGSTAEVTVRFEDDDTFVKTLVQDTGRGMDAETASHIFERFYRADKSRSRASGGSGLGLAITKSIVEKHGGTVTVDSAPGEGTTFTVRLERPAPPKLNEV